MQKVSMRSFSSAIDEPMLFQIRYELPNLARHINNSIQNSDFKSNAKAQGAQGNFSAMDEHPAFALLRLGRRIKTDSQSCAMTRFLSFPHPCFISVNGLASFTTASVSLPLGPFAGHDGRCSHIFSRPPGEGGPMVVCTDFFLQKITKATKVPESLRRLTIRPGRSAKEVLESFGLLPQLFFYFGKRGV
jgi:hypothetical protein